MVLSKVFVIVFKKLVKASKTTQRKLADEIGVDESRISNWVAFKDPLSEELLLKLSKLLGVTLQDLKDSRPEPRHVKSFQDRLAGQKEPGWILGEGRTESDLEIWRRRAQAAEEKIAALQEGLRGLLRLSSSMALPPEPAPAAKLEGVSSKIIAVEGEASMPDAEEAASQIQESPPKPEAVAPSARKRSRDSGAGKAS
jgi:transcriptional regulator with XRE-family HTH domain